MLKYVKQIFPLKTILSAVIAVNMATISSASFAQVTMVEDEEPSILAMYTDLLVLRPVGAATTVIGAAAYLVSLPFTLPVGRSTQVGKKLVAGPALFTFYRCLGCTRTGYNEMKQSTP